MNKFNNYLTGRLFKKMGHNDQAKTYLEIAGNDGHKNAQFNLGEIYDHDDDDETLARYWYIKAANQGHVKANFNLGEIHSFRGDDDISEIYYYNAAVGGHIESQYILGFFNIDGDEKLSIKWFKLAAEQGHYESIFQLGILYLHGSFKVKDYVEAKRWFQLGIDMGSEKCVEYLQRAIIADKKIPGNTLERIKNE